MPVRFLLVLAFCITSNNFVNSEVEEVTVEKEAVVDAVDVQGDSASTVSTANTASTTGMATRLLLLPMLAPPPLLLIPRQVPLLPKLLLVNWLPRTLLPTARPQLSTLLSPMFTTTRNGKKHRHHKHKHASASVSAVPSATVSAAATATVA
ncbi:hypothetical protein CPC08DRAFT_368929 [Agrocybe pediades]|nr:hypothetical protein CPC08DRAFT_368929 [Agrocybe pediades]